VPIYTYKCDTCGHEEEQIRNMDEREREDPCPDAWSDPDTVEERCGGTLKPSDEIELTARMPDAWRF